MTTKQRHPMDDYWDTKSESVDRLRDHVAAALYPFAIDESSRGYPLCKTEEERRQKLRDIAKICYMAADEFVKFRK